MQLLLYMRTRRKPSADFPAFSNFFFVFAAVMHKRLPVFQNRKLAFSL